MCDHKRCLLETQFLSVWARRVSTVSHVVMLDNDKQKTLTLTDVANWNVCILISIDTDRRCWQRLTHTCVATSHYGWGVLTDGGHYTNAPSYLSISLSVPTTYLDYLVVSVLEMQTTNRRSFHNHKEGPFSWLKAHNSTFTFKTLLTQHKTKD